MRSNGQTVMMKLIVTFRNFANAPKNCVQRFEISQALSPKRHLNHTVVSVCVCVCPTKSTYCIQAIHVMSEFQLFEIVPTIQRCNGRGFVTSLVKFQVPFWQMVICCHVLAVKCSCKDKMRTHHNLEIPNCTMYQMTLSFISVDRC